MSKRPCISTKLWEEATAHCRWKAAMKTFQRTLDPIALAEMSFDEIYATIYKSRPKGVGKLGCYDITSSIMRYVKREIVPCVYLVGNGPKDAIFKLSLLHRIEKKKIEGAGTLPYITIEYVINRLKSKGIAYPKHIETDGDALETWLCNWQKDVKGVI
jgi:hypothetical protein